MAAEIGKNFAGLIADLKANAPLFSVFQAIYLAETISQPLHPDRDEEKFDQKGLRFRPYENYAFPPRDIHAFEMHDTTMSFVLTFMGLYGIDSPLPRLYHEQIPLQQNVHGPGQVPFQNFLDMFNTRFYWLYYQAWKKYRYYLQLKGQPGNRILERIFAFTGLAYHGKTLDAEVPRFKWLRLSSLLSHRLRNKTGLLLFLQEFFPRVKFGLEEFVPCRVELDERPKLGRFSKEQALRLSRHSVIGRTKLDCMGRVCVDLGPMDFADYLDFTPGSRNLNLLKKLLDLYLNDGLEYDVRFIIRSRTILRLPLKDHRLKLGISYWMGRPAAETVGVHYPYERLAGTV
jgi:type VI secretion system protein ImpH